MRRRRKKEKATIPRKWIPRQKQQRPRPPQHQQTRRRRGARFAQRSLLFAISFAILSLLKLHPLADNNLHHKSEIDLPQQQHNTTKQERDEKIVRQLPWLVIRNDNEGKINTEAYQDQEAATLPDENDWLVLDEPVFYNRDSHYQQYGQLIPKIIHKVILTTEGHFDETVGQILNVTRNVTSSSTIRKGSLLHAHWSWKQMNPQYEIRYFNLHLCRSYLRLYFHPIFLRAFDCIEAFAGKADFFRLLVVYREGGYYSDWKQECKVEGLLDWTSKDNATWFATWDRGHKVKTSLPLQNAFFGATPQSPVLAEAIRTVLQNIQMRLDLKTGTNALQMTGVYVLGEAFHKVRDRLHPGEVRLGKFMHGWGQRYLYETKVIVVHKCDECGKDQNWSRGNNYVQKHKLGEYFCPDAPSLFSAS